MWRGKRSTIVIVIVIVMVLLIVMTSIRVLSRRE